MSVLFAVLYGDFLVSVLCAVLYGYFFPYSGTYYKGSFSVKEKRIAGNFSKSKQSYL